MEGSSQQHCIPDQIRNDRVSAAPRLVRLVVEARPDHGNGRTLAHETATRPWSFGEITVPPALGSVTVKAPT